MAELCAACAAQTQQHAAFAEHCTPTNLMSLPPDLSRHHKLISRANTCINVPILQHSGALGREAVRNGMQYMYVD